MRTRTFAIMALAMSAAGGVYAQEIVKVPESVANVSRPDDLFELAPDQWHFSKSHAFGMEPCLPDQCEAGFTSGDLVVSAEHSKTFVRIIAGFRNCERTAYSEVDVGKSPGKNTLRRVSKQVKRVVKGLAKTCKATAPVVPELEVARLFPAA